MRRQSHLVPTMASKEDLMYMQYSLLKKTKTMVVATIAPLKNVISNLHHRVEVLEIKLPAPTPSQSITSDVKTLLDIWILLIGVWFSLDFMSEWLVPKGRNILKTN